MKTDAEINAAVAEACRFDLWVIMKRGLYYRRNACGYTASIQEAWQLPREEAKKYEMYAGRDDVPSCEVVMIMPAPLPDYTGNTDVIRKVVLEQSREFQTLFDARMRCQLLTICIQDLTARHWCECFLNVYNSDKF